MFRVSSLAALGAFGLLAAVANGQHAERYGIGCGEKGALSVIDGHVYVTRSRDADDLWRVERSARGYTIRLFAGKWRLRYLTGDSKGNVTLAEKPSDGSYWSLDMEAAERFGKTKVSLHGRKDGPRNLTAGEEMVTIADENGKEQRAILPKLTEQAGSNFSITVISP